MLVHGRCRYVCLFTDVVGVVDGFRSRDGNPNVTPAVTREVSFTARREAATLYLKDVKALTMELSTTKYVTHSEKQIVVLLLLLLSSLPWSSIVLSHLVGIASSHLVLSRLIVCLPVLSCPISSYLVFSRLILYYLVLSCPVLSCLVLSCLAALMLVPGLESSPADAICAIVIVVVLDAQRRCGDAFAGVGVVML